MDEETRTPKPGEYLWRVVEDDRITYFNNQQVAVDYTRQKPKARRYQYHSRNNANSVWNEKEVM